MYSLIERPTTVTAYLSSSILSKGGFLEGGAGGVAIQEQ